MVCVDTHADAVNGLRSYSTHQALAGTLYLWNGRRRLLREVLAKVATGRKQHWKQRLCLGQRWRHGPGGLFTRVP